MPWLGGLPDHNRLLISHLPLSPLLNPSPIMSWKRSTLSRGGFSPASECQFSARTYLCTPGLMICGEEKTWLEPCQQTQTVLIN